MTIQLNKAANENKIIIRDNLSGGSVTFNYRFPTTKERNAYSNEFITRRGKKVESNAVFTRLKFGEKILTGIKDGDFEIEKEGKSIPVSSNETSPAYDPQWKDYIADYVPHLIEKLAEVVFERNSDDEDDSADDIEKN